MPRHVVLHLRRTRYLPKDGGGTVYCVMTYTGDLFGALAYLRPGLYPEFDGDEGWFRVEWHSKKRFKVLEQVADRSGTPLN